MMFTSVISSMFPGQGLELESTTCPSMVSVETALAAPAGRDREDDAAACAAGPAGAGAGSTMSSVRIKLGVRAWRFERAAPVAAIAPFKNPGPRVPAKPSQGFVYQCSDLSRKRISGLNARSQRRSAKGGRLVEYAEGAATGRGAAVGTTRRRRAPSCMDSAADHTTSRSAWDARETAAPLVGEMANR